MSPSEQESYVAPRELGVFIAAPFNSRFIVDHRALARSPALPRRLCDKLASSPPQGVMNVVYEMPERTTEFNDGTGGRVSRPESLVRFDLASPLDLLAGTDPEGAVLAEPARLADIEVSYHEYGTAVITGWIRIRLSGASEGSRVAELLRSVNERIQESGSLARLIFELDERVQEVGDALLQELDDYQGFLEPAEPVLKVRWSHAVAVWEYGGGLLEDEQARSYARRLVIVSDEAFKDMCPSSPGFIYIGWLRSILVGDFDLDTLEENTHELAPSSPALLSLSALRRLQVDWLAADRLNRLLAEQLRKYSRQRKRLSPRQIRRDMEWIEQVTVEVELHESAKSLRQQMMSPYCFQVYEGATRGWRMDDQRADYMRMLGALDKLYERTKTELEMRGRRSTEYGLAILSALVLIRAVYDAWELMGLKELEFDGTHAGTWTLVGVLALVFALAVVFWRRLRI